MVVDPMSVKSRLLAVVAHWLTLINSGVRYLSKPVMTKRLSTLKSVSRTAFSLTAVLNPQIDPVTFKEARAGIPVTTQRRFDVYPDVSKSA